MDSMLSRFSELPKISEVLDELVLMEAEYMAMQDRFNASSCRRAFGHLKQWATEYKSSQIEYQQVQKILDGLPDRIVSVKLRALVDALVSPVSPITRVDADRICFPSASGRRSVFEFASEEDCTCEWRKYSRVAKPMEFCWHIVATNAIVRTLVAKAAKEEAKK